MSKITTEEVTISFEKYQSLREAELFLDALEAVGVDEWEGYDQAKELLMEWDND